MRLVVDAGKMGKRLTAEGQALEDEFFAEYLSKGRGCYCWRCAPCSYCTHLGNPISLECADDLWEEELIDLELMELEARMEIERVVEFEARIVQLAVGNAFAIDKAEANVRMKKLYNEFGVKYQ